MSRKLLKTLIIGSDVLQLFEVTPLIGIKEYSIDFTDASRNTVTAVLTFKSNAFIEECDIPITIFFKIHLYYEILAWNRKRAIVAPETSNIPEVKDLLELISCGKLYNFTTGSTGNYFYYEDFNCEQLSASFRRFITGVNDKRRHVVLNINNFMKGDMLLYTEDRILAKNEKLHSIIPRRKVNLSELNPLIYQNSELSVTPKSLWEQMV